MIKRHQLLKGNLYCSRYLCMCYVYRGQSIIISSVCFEVLKQRKKIKEMWKTSTILEPQ